MVRGSVRHCGDDPVWYITTCHLVRFVYDLSVHHAFSSFRADFLMLGLDSSGDKLSESLKIIMIRHVLGKLQLVARGTPCQCPFLSILVFRLFPKVPSYVRGVFFGFSILVQHCRTP